eukprot:XP_019857330.1 PREDICTED: uncharacterized protein LOC109585635 [Amphimedon queenslandica]
MNPSPPTLRRWHLPRLHPVAFAVWRRNALVWKRLFVSSLVLHFGEPLLYLIGIGYGLGRFIDGMEGMEGISYLSFFASGLVASSTMMSSSYEATYSVYTRMVPQKTYDGIIATPVEIDDIVAGEMLWCATKGCMAGASLLIVGVLIGAFAGLKALLCIPILLLIGLAFSGIALAVSATAPSYDYFSYYLTLFITPMFILCGVFYPIASMPAIVQGLVQLLPLTHAVALVRPIVTGQALENPILHIAVLLAFACIGFYIAVVLVRRRFIL